MGTSFCCFGPNTKTQVLVEGLASYPGADAEEPEAPDDVLDQTSRPSILLSDSTQIRREDRNYTYKVINTGTLKSNGSNEDEEEMAMAARVSWTNIERVSSRRSNLERVRTTLTAGSPALSPPTSPQNRPSPPGTPQAFAGKDSPRMAEEDDAEAKQSLDNDLQQLDTLLNISYDVLAADLLLSEMKATLPSDSPGWRHVLGSEAFKNFERKIGFFMEIGDSCTAKTDSNWFSIFAAPDGSQTIDGCFDPKDPNVLNYRVKAYIPARLSQALSVANEIQLMPEWNALVTGAPKVIGRRTAHYLVLNYQMTLLGGLYKIDMLSEVRRFSDVQGGFLAEFIESVPADHPSYVHPQPGFKRPQTLVQNVWAACGPNHCLLIQSGKAKLPFRLSQWVAQSIGGVAGKFIVGGLVANSLRATEPGNPWEKLLEADELGFYNSMDLCADSAASEERTPPKGSACASPFELDHFFKARDLARFHTD